MKYMVIGLGIFGSNLAADLTTHGDEVVGIDYDAKLVENIKDKISAAFILDTTDEAALSSLPLNSIDAVIVTIGENFGASVRTVALLKKLNVRNIYARAIDNIHHSILDAMAIKRIITPEQQAASDLVMELSFGADVCSMPVGGDLWVVKLPLPKKYVGLLYNDLTNSSKFKLKLISIMRPTTTTSAFGTQKTTLNSLPEESIAQTEAKADDILVCLGKKHDFLTLI